MTQHIDRVTPLGPAAEARERKLTVDRTSSMTAGQVERFWKLATLAFVQEVHRTMRDEGVQLVEALLVVGHDKLDGIASDMLEVVAGR